jgi:hypothetical protein
MIYIVGRAGEEVIVVYFKELSKNSLINKLRESMKCP